MEWIEIETMIGHIVQVYAERPPSLRMRELESLGFLAKNANVQIYAGFDGHIQATGKGESE